MPFGYFLSGKQSTYGLYQEDSHPHLTRNNPKEISVW